MTPVYFSNSGLIDLDVIRVMGVSIKRNDNPIGYFGTGLKFAIATLLRTSHKIVLIRDGEKYEFTARDATIRGQKFARVFMNEEPLPFTTELGRNWDVWQAYRELHSNTLDEAGQITDQPISGDTIFKVTGTGIEREFINRDSIFISGKPLAANEHLEVFEGVTNNIFYRGVRAGSIGSEMRFTYNLLTPMTLTEDRTFESQFTVEWKLAQLIPKIKNKWVASELLDGTKYWDQNLSFTDCGSPSSEFLETAAARYTDTNSSSAAKKLVDRDMQNRGNFPPAALLDHEAEKFLSAFSVLQKMGCNLSPEDVEVTESLGPNCMAIYHQSRDQIFLAKSTLDWGLETVAATLYEEWLHKVYKYKDNSRGMQNFLFQRLVALTMGKDAPQPEMQVN